MSFDYAEIASEAAAIIAEFGSPATLTRQQTTAATSYNPAAGTVTAPTAQVDAISACAFPVADRLIDGTSIRAGDLQAFIAAVGLTEPRPGDVMAWQGKSFTVISGKSLAPAGVAVLYEAIVRGV